MSTSSHPSLSISIFGLGYVGSVMAACLAEMGHHVIGVDINPRKIEQVNAGRSPVIEPGMDELVCKQRQAGRLRAILDAEQAVRETQISFVCVGTPSLRNGGLDLSSVELACSQLGGAMSRLSRTHIVGIRSTVLPGTIAEILLPALQRASDKQVGTEFHICANPEFMREGSAIHDFFHPPFTLFGADDHGILQTLRELYSPITAPCFATSVRTAEMVKYVCNAFHALKIDFANEVGALAQCMGVDANEVMQIVCADTKLNLSAVYLKPGFAFGGSCLPKDVKALSYRARQMDLDLPLLRSIVPSNQAQIDRAIERIADLGKRRLTLLGLSFKADSDDLRESPLLQLVKRLIGDGYQLKIYDPNISQSIVHGSNREFAEHEVPHIFSLLCDRMEDAVRDAEVLVVGHPTREYARIAEAFSLNGIVVDLTRGTSSIPAFTAQPALAA